MSTEIDQVQAIKDLTRELQLNDLGMPLGIYRHDLLPYHDYNPASHPTPPTPPTPPDKASTGSEFIELEETNPSEFGLPEGPHQTQEVVETRIAGFPADMLRNAYMSLQYDEGFPAFVTGLPFWSRMEHEPAEAHAAFQQYLHMSHGKAPELGADEDVDYDGEHASGHRSISQLASEMFSNDDLIRGMQVLQGYATLYYWNQRAHAYDLCRVAQYRAQQEMRALETQDEHYVMARRLRHKVESYIDGNEDFWDLMTPKTALEILKSVASIERISAGLPSAGPPSEAPAQGKSFEVQLQTIANSNRHVKDVQDDEGEGDVLDLALQDPDSVETLQRLIIKVGG